MKRVKERVERGGEENRKKSITEKKPIKSLKTLSECLQMQNSTYFQQ
jgi:hypothetical protein